MKKCVSLLIASLILATGSITLFGQATTEKLATGTFIVYGVSPQAFRFTVDPKTMANVTVTGHFATSAGTPKDIEVYVFNEDSFFKWRGEDEAAKASAKPLFSSGRKAEGDVNVKVTEPGNYYIVFSNMYQYEGTKTINTDVKLQFDKR